MLDLLDPYVVSLWKDFETKCIFGSYIYNTYDYNIKLIDFMSAAKEKDYFVIVLLSSETPIAILPFEFVNIKSKTVRFLNESIHDICPVIAVETFSLKQVVFDIKEIFSLRINELKKVPLEISEGLDRRYVVDLPSCWIINLKSQDVDSKLSAFNKKVRKDYNLHRLGDVEHDSSFKFIDLILDFKILQLKRTRRRNYLKSGVFHRIYADKFHSKTFKCVDSLLCDGKFLAGHIGFISGGHYSYQLPVYDVNFSKFSVGNILLSDLIQRAILQNFQSFSLGIGDEPYKKKLATDVVQLCDIHFTSYSKFKYVFLQSVKKILKYFSKSIYVN